VQHLLTTDDHKTQQLPPNMSETVVPSVLPQIENEWQQEASKIQPTLLDYQDKLMGQPRDVSQVRILRVNQLDAQILDKELNDILKMQFMKIFSFFKAESISRFTPELELFLELIIFRISVWSLNTTYGNQLQNLYFAALTPTKKVLLFLATSGYKYLSARLGHVPAQLLSHVLPLTAQRRVLQHRAWSALKVLSLLNYLHFLYSGQYLTLVHRLLRIRLLYRRPSIARKISFEYMNRQLVWNGFTEFMQFIVPMLELHRARHYLTRVTRHWWSNYSAPRTVTESSACVVCGAVPQMAHSSKCGHVGCYYCLQLLLLEDSKAPCPGCGEQIHSLTRVQGL
jgi:peroxin-2